MSETLGVLFDFYASADTADQPSLGSLCWAPVAYPAKTINVVRAVSDNPATPEHQQYKIVQAPIGGLGKDGTPLGHRFPDANLRLGAGEDLLVVRAKVRAVVAVFNPRSRLLEAVKDKAVPPKEIEDCLGCFPSYTMVDREGNPRRKRPFIEGVRALKYAVFFPMPRHRSFNKREVFLRMDRLLWLPRDVLQPMAVKLNGNGVKMVLSWFCRFAGIKPLDEELAAARDMLIEELEQQRDTER